MELLFCLDCFRMRLRVFWVCLIVYVSFVLYCGLDFVLFIAAFVFVIYYFPIFNAITLNWLVGVYGVGCCLAASSFCLGGLTALRFCLVCRIGIRMIP